MPGRLVQGFSFCCDCDHGMDVTEHRHSRVDFPSCHPSGNMNHFLLSLSREWHFLTQKQTIFIFCRLFKCRMEADLEGRNLRWFPFHDPCNPLVSRWSFTILLPCEAVVLCLAHSPLRSAPLFLRAIVDRGLTWPPVPLSITLWVSGWDCGSRGGPLFTGMMNQAELGFELLCTPSWLVLASFPCVFLCLFSNSLRSLCTSHFNAMVS